MRKGFVRKSPDRKSGMPAWEPRAEDLRFQQQKGESRIHWINREIQKYPCARKIHDLLDAQGILDAYYALPVGKLLPGVCIEAIQALETIPGLRKVIRERIQSVTTQSPVNGVHPQVLSVEADPKILTLKQELDAEIPQYVENQNRGKISEKLWMKIFAYRDLLIQAGLNVQELLYDRYTIREAIILKAKAHYKK